MTKSTSFTLLVALAVGLIGASVIWLANPPLFSSTATVHAVLKGMTNVGNSSGPHWDGAYPDVHMRSLRDLILSQRNFDVAVKNRVWKEMAVSVPAEPGAYFAGHLCVTADPTTGLIKITENDANPRMAAAAVRAVIDAFLNLYFARQSQRQQQRIGLLQEQQKIDSSRIDELKARKHDAIANTRHDGDQTADALAESQQTMDKLNAGLAAATRDVMKITKRLDVIQAEAADSFGMTLISQGEISAIPSIDHGIAYASIAGVCGFFSILALSFLFSHRHFKLVHSGTIGQAQLENA